MLWFFSFILIPLINSDDPCNINSESIGSNFINLDPSVSTVTNVHIGKLNFETEISAKVVQKR